MEINQKAIEKVLQVAKRLDTLRMVNGYEGNVSMKDNGLIYITPSGKSKADLTPEMITVVTEDGEKVAGLYKASSELPMHLALYKMDPALHGVVHAHPIYLTAYALCNKPIRTTSHTEFLYDHKSIEVIPYGRPGTKDIYAGADEILKTGRRTFLLGNHGSVSVGETLDEALLRTETAEHAAETFAAARHVGDMVDLPSWDLPRYGVTYEKFGG